MTNYEWFGIIQKYWIKRGHKDLDIWKEISFINWASRESVAFRDDYIKK